MAGDVRTHHRRSRTLRLWAFLTNTLDSAVWALPGSSDGHLAGAGLSTYHLSVGLLSIRITLRGGLHRTGRFVRSFLTNRAVLRPVMLFAIVNATIGAAGLRAGLHHDQRRPAETTWSASSHYGWASTLRQLGYAVGALTGAAVVVLVSSLIFMKICAPRNTTIGARTRCSGKLVREQAEAHAGIRPRGCCCRSWRCSGRRSCSMPSTVTMTSFKRPMRSSRSR